MKSIAASFRLLPILSLLGVIPVAGQPQTINGNLTVNGWISSTGSIDSDGSSFTFGNQSGGIDVGLYYFPDAMPGGTNDTLKFSLNRISASWLWMHAAGGTNPTGKAMRLDASHQLTLFKSDGATAGVSLIPAASPQLSLGSATLTGDVSSGGFSTSGAFSVGGNFNFNGADGKVTTDSSGIVLEAVGGNKSVTLSSSGTGDLVFNAGSTERARVKSTGNVGIGTSGPGALLDVAGTVAIGTTANGSSIALRSYSDGRTWGIRDDYGVNRLRFARGSTDQVFWDVLKTPSSDAIAGQIWYVGGAERIRLDSSGYVGIGTSSPGAQLEVASTQPYTLYLSGNAPSLFLGASSGAFPNSSANTATGAVGFSTVSGAYGQGKGDLNIVTQSRGSGNTSAINFLTPADDSGNYALAVKIARNGNVGIGTTSPDAKLDVSGSLLLNSSNGVYNHYRNVAAVYLGAGGSTGTLKITLPAYSSYTMLNVTIRGYDYSGSGAWTVTIGGYNADHSWHKCSAKIEGRAPFKTVRLANNGVSDLILLGDVSTTWTYAHIEVSDVIAGYVNIRGWGSNWVMGLITNETGISNISTPTIDMYTNASGNIGIGTTSPTHKLSVNGPIRAKEIIVDTGWADYVFDESYRLAPLSEVEAHIREKKHLPGIPSAVEIESRGVSLGEMQAKLLEKIEELTLRQIAQEKRLNAQAERIGALEAENATLRAR